MKWCSARQGGRSFFDARVGVRRRAMISVRGLLSQVGRDSGSVGINPNASGFQRKSRLIVIAVGDSAGLVVLRRLQGVDSFRQRNNSAGVYHM